MFLGQSNIQRSALAGYSVVGFRDASATSRILVVRLVERTALSFGRIFRCRFSECLSRLSYSCSQFSRTYSAQTRAVTLCRPLLCRSRLSYPFSLVSRTNNAHPWVVISFAALVAGGKDFPLACRPCVLGGWRDIFYVIFGHCYLE